MVSASDTFTPLSIDEFKSIRTIDSCKAELENYYITGPDRGFRIGWPLLSNHYRVSKGQFTVVTGIPSSGKSEFLDSLMINMGREHGWRFAVFSPENYPLQYHCSKLLEKWLERPMNREPDQNRRADAYDFVRDHFYFVAMGEEPTLDNILNDARALVCTDKIEGLVIDPWNEIEHQRPRDLTETEYISKCLSQIRNFARCHKVHVWIMAHPTKLQKDRVTGAYPCPTPYDISGSAHWRNKADCCLTVHRPDLTTNDVEIHIQKIRFKWNGMPGLMKMTWDHYSGLFEERIGE